MTLAKWQRLGYYTEAWFAKHGMAMPASYQQEKATCPTSSKKAASGLTT
jgi:hypothetical protein